MVNTFLVHPDFRESATQLDPKRLGKQRVEAYQILNLCLDLQFLSKYFSCPIDFNNLKDWIGAIVSAYKKLDYQFVIPLKLFLGPNNFHQIYIPVLKSSDSNLKETMKSANMIFRYRGYLGTEKVDFLIKHVPKLLKGIKTEFEPNECFSRLMSLGFVYHPVVRMWLGYEKALAEYINAHIDVWVSRGYNNEMERYNIVGEIVYPRWVNLPDLHNCHKASLNRKDPSYYSEYSRELVRWYELYPAQGQPGKKFDYIWPM